MIGEHIKWDYLMKGVVLLIFGFIAILIISSVFLALWNPATGTGIRMSLYNIINDSYFTTTFGTNIRDAIVYILDFLPLAVFFGLLGGLFLTVGYITYVGVKGE